MKSLISVEESLKKCPPSEIYKKITGVKFKKRVLLKRGKDGVVNYDELNNPRVYYINVKDVPPIADSFIVNGYLYTEKPPTVKVDPKDPEKFVGLSGWHRDAAADQAGWDTMIYDVLEFDSPLSERIWTGGKSQDHRRPFVKVTLDDIAKQVLEAISKKEIPNEDSKIKWLISQMASDKTSNSQTRIFKIVRSHVSNSTTVVNYSTKGGISSTEEFAKKYNIPYAGDAGWENTKRLGYITGSKTPKTSLYDAKKLSKEYKGQEVEIYAWIQENPKTGVALHNQREAWKKKFDEFILEDCIFIRNLAKLCGYEISLDDLVKNHPIKFKGFLAQDKTPDPFNGGNPMEIGVVGITGKPVR
jgi:hypothetical protein